MGQPSLRDGAREWSEEGGGDGSGEACTCKYLEGQVSTQNHLSVPLTTPLPPTQRSCGSRSWVIAWAVRMPSQGGRLLTHRAMRSSPKRFVWDEIQGLLLHTPHPKSAPAPPRPSLSPLCEARSLFVILHKSAAIKMHWSRTALGRDPLAFPGQRPASLHIQWGLFLKVNAFSLGEGKGLPLKQWGGGRERGRDNPPFPSPFCSSPRSRPFASHIQGEQEESPQPGREGSGGGPNLFWRGN